MTFGFALLLSGWVLLDAGWKGVTPFDVLKGVTANTKGPGGVLRETGQDVLASFSGKGHSEYSGETGGKSGGGGGASDALKHVGGTVQMDGHPVAKWIAVELLWAREHGWKGRVESGYRSKAEQERIYNSGVRPAAVPGTSNHEKKRYPGGAVDVTEAEQLDQILSRKKGRLLKWTGNSIGDTVHFSSGLNGV
jgi:hypothetical protein